MKLRALSLALTLLLPFASAQAQQPEPAGVSAEVYADIETFLQLTGARAVGLQMSAAMSDPMINALRQSNPNFTDAQAEITKQVVNDFVTRFLNDKATTDMFVDVYSKHLTAAEIKELNAFYASPVAQKLVAAQPLMMQETMLASQQLFVQQWIPQLQQELMARLQAASTAPAPAAPPAANSPAANPPAASNPAPATAPNPAQ